MRRSAVLLALMAAPLLGALAGCASYDPNDRVVRARFACTDGQKLRVQFRLDRKDAVIRRDTAKTVTLPATGALRGRSYAGMSPEGAYSLQGLGDRIEWRAPGAPPLTCEETH